MDLLIKHGLIYDGSGELPFSGDILIRDGRIAQIAPQLGGENSSDTEVIDAGGMAVTPGFIDIHRHCDIMPFINPHFGEIELTQGITTAFVGNCGLAPVPSVPLWRQQLYDYLDPVIGTMPEPLVFADYEDYFKALEQAVLPVNMGVLAGSDSIKIALKGFGSEAYTEGELEQAQAYVRQALDLGAFGLTLGIMYQPECYSGKDELIAVVRAAAGRNVVLCTHIRGEGDSLVESVDEVIEVAGRAGVPLNISHFKATGVKNWNRKLYQAITRIEQARAAGQDVTADFYPYDGGSTTLQSLLPPTVMEADMERLFHKLGSPEGKRLLRQELGRVHEGWDNMSDSIGWERILISSVTLEKHTFMQGKTIGQLARELGCQEPSDLAAELLAEEKGKVGIIVLSMSQEDVDTVAKLPYTILISDALYGGDTKFAHPRLLGATARFLREYVGERQVLTMEQAIRKMTALPALRMGLTDRGLLKAGYQADILIFDPDKFRDHAGYTGSRELCTGLELVLLGGEKVLEHGRVRALDKGKLLRKTDY